MLALLRRIPRCGADYLISADEAAGRYGCDEAALSALRAAGLTDDEGRCFARMDVHYLGLRLGLARQHLWAVGAWRRSLERFVSELRTPVRIAYLPRVRDEQHEVRGRVVLADGRLREVALRDNQVAAEVAVTMHAEWPEVPHDVVAVLEDVGSLEFCLLPPPLRGDGALARELGLTDCFTAACLIAEGCRTAGHAVRIAHGLMVATPFSNQHTWAEVKVDGVWTPVDPLMISVMHRFAGLDPSAWPLRRSLGPLLARLLVVSQPIPLLTAGGEPIPTTFLTRIE